MGEMDPLQANVTGLQLNARYYDDMKKEWNLCKAHIDSLQSLGVSEVSLIWCMNEALNFPKLKTLQFFIKGEVDMRTNRKPVTDWRLVNDNFRRIKAWMSLHSFPMLDRLEIHWASDVLMKNWSLEEIYTEKGPEMIRVDEYDYEYMNMDALMNYYGIHELNVDTVWLKSLPLQTLVLSKAIYDVLSKQEYPFHVMSGSDFTQEDVEKMLECLHDY